MHTKKKQSGCDPKSFAIPGETMMEHNLPRPLKALGFLSGIEEAKFAFDIGSALAESFSCAVHR